MDNGILVCISLENDKSKDNAVTNILERLTERKKCMNPEFCVQQKYFSKQEGNKDISRQKMSKFANPSAVKEIQRKFLGVEGTNPAGKLEPASRNEELCSQAHVKLSTSGWL